METCKLCSRKVYIKKYGFCSKHYSRYIKHENPHGGKYIRDGSSRQKTKAIYNGMKRRCYDPKCNIYKYYGGRGIKVCDRWLGIYGYTNFIEDMGEIPTGKSLDRIDPNKWYSKDNCRWATPKEQANNRTSNRVIKYAGKSMTISEWSETTGIPYATLYYRITKYKWPVERALGYLQSKEYGMEEV